MVRFLFLAILLSAQAAFALSENVRRWIIYETMLNAAAFRDPLPIPIEHFEIPLEAAKMWTSMTSDKEAIRSLVFKKNGKDFVRWIINPEDTKWHVELRGKLIAAGLDGKKYRYFRGYKSASRSYFIEDPVTGYEFFAKVSTDKTGGAWKDKKQDWKDAREIKIAADALQEALKAYSPRHLKTLNETLVFGFEAADQAMVIRSIAEIRDTPFFYVPGFSVLHEREGRLLAEINGSKDPQAFWNEHYNKPLARAMAEYNIMTGLTFDSPHSQNFLVELDAGLKPTGKIVFRDFGDAYVSVEYRKELGGNLARHWPQELQRHGTMSGTIGVLHGNQHPSWLPDAVYNDWGRTYGETYDREVSRLTGITLKELSASTHDIFRDGKYFYRKYDLTTPAWREFRNSLQGTGYRGPMPLRCSRVFAR